MRTNLRTEQRLVVSQRLRQQLSVLHMTLQEVTELVSEEIQSNPMLEFDETPASGGMFSDVSLETVYAAQREDPAQESGGEYLPNLCGENRYRASKSNGEEHTSSFLDYTCRPESLSEYLTMQLLDYPLTEAQRKMCQYLIASLDERGFFCDSLDLIAETFHVDLFELTQMLYVIQSLDPVGIGARDLQECLILQLAAGDQFNSHTVRIVKEGLVLLSQNKITAIARLLGVEPAEAKRYCGVVRSLSPIPARGYYTGGDKGYIIPDAVVLRKGPGFAVQMNDSMIPRLIINEEYSRMLDDSDDRELRSYVKTNMTSARNLITDIAARQKTLYQLICEVVKKQPEFFTDGKTLRPMMMSEIAEELGLHVSTVSRAIRGKYIICAAGTVSLRTLFTSGYAGQQTNAVSAAVVKRKLVELISEEDRNAPLSDDALCRILGGMNIELSRRTVAKYREEQGIPSSKQRKGNWI